MEKNNQTTKNVTKNKEELLSLSDYFFLNKTVLSILILPFPKESLDRKKMFYSKDCLLNNLIKILLNNYTAVVCLMKCFQCSLNVNSNSVKLLCALCIKQPAVM